VTTSRSCMKILCVIDHFGSGGAQRQLVNLAIGLQARGHHVEIFVYYPHRAFFRPIVAQAGIPVHEVHKGRGFSVKVLWRLVRLLRHESYDGVISFLHSPNIYAELARSLSPGTKLIVSERSSHHGDRNRLSALIGRILHGLADVVVANSHSHARWLRRYPWLKRRTTTVYNGYPIEEFAAPHTEFKPPIRLLVIGRIGPEKNGLQLIEGLRLCRPINGYIPMVSWAGAQDDRLMGRAYRRELDACLDLQPDIKSRWTWLGERSDIPNLLQQHHALIHPALYEGLPNVVCEAMLAGRPILISDVCDHALLIEERTRGFLFDPNDAQSIANAIERLCELSEGEWLQLSTNVRQYALRNLSIERMVQAYESLLMNGKVHPGAEA
jgi:glycosyltransferase involved in cell wall biosynthesis